MKFLNRYFTSIPATAYSPASLAPRPFRIAIDGFIALFALYTVFSGFYIVGEGHRAVVTRMGEVITTQDAGLHFKLPIIDSVHKMNVRAQTAEVKKAGGGTADMQNVTVDLVARFSIRENKVAHVYKNYSPDGDMDSFVNTALAESFKAVTAGFTAPHLILKRNEVSRQVFTTLQAKVDRYGLEVENIDMTDFDFDKEYMATINKKVQEDQKLLTEEKVLERVKVQEQQKVEVAKAEAEAKKATTDAEAYQMKQIALAKAEAINAEGKALRENANVAELRRIEVEMRKAESWNGALPTHIYGSAPIPFMNAMPSK